MTTKILLEQTVHGQPSGNYDGSSQDFTADPQEGPGYYLGYSGVQTLTVSVTDFDGVVHIEGTLDSDPHVANWVEVFSFEDSSAGQSYVEIVDLLGQFVWMRTRITGFAAGTINEIVTQYSAGTLVVAGHYHSLISHS